MPTSVDRVHEEPDDGARREPPGRTLHLGRTLAWLVLPPSILLAPLSGFLLLMVQRTGSHEPWHAWNLVWTTFDIGDEANVAVWIASSFWLLLGVLAALAALTSERFTRSWWLFAVVAVIASADEAGQLHEKLFVVGDRMAPFVPIDVHYNWVIPGAILALLVGALLLRLVLALRRRVGIGLIVAGATFLTGALVIETITGLVQRAEGEMTNTYYVLMYIEETFELVGVAIAIIALASMFRVTRYSGGLSVRFDGFRPTTT